MAMPLGSRSDRPAVQSRWTRDVRLLLGMCLMVGGLALLETFTLWCLGASYIPPRSIRKATVADFALSSDGRWGVSRLRLDRSGTFEQSVETVVCLHDLQNLDKVQRLAVECDDIVRVALAPTGDRMAFVAGDGSVQMATIHDPASAPRTFGQVSRDVIGHLTWSPDGEWLVAVGIQVTYVWRMPSGELVHKFLHGSSSKPAVCISSDSRHLLVTDDVQIQIWSLEEATCRKSIPASLGATTATLTSDGRLLVVNSRNHGLCVWDLEGEVELWSSQTARWPWTPVALLASERRVASVERQRRGAMHRDQVVIRCVESGHVIKTIDVGVGHVAGLTAAPDGTLIVWGDEGKVVGWDVSGPSELWRVVCLENWEN